MDHPSTASRSPRTTPVIVTKTSTPAARLASQLHERRHVLELAGAFIVILAGGLLLLYINRNQWFFADEWAFLLGRDGGSLHDLIRPHNEHWSTIPVVAYRILFNVFGLTTYLPYMATLVLIHVLLGSLVFLVLRRQGGPWSVAVAAGLFVLFIGRGYENLTWAFQIGFVGSIVAALGAILLLQNNSSRADFGASLLLIIALMSSGIGVAALGGVILTLLFRGEYRRLFWVALAPLLVYGAWFLSQRHLILSSHQPDLIESLLLLPSYVAVGLMSTFEGLVGFGQPVGMGVVVIALAGILVWLAGRRTRLVPTGILGPLLIALTILGLAGLSRASVFGVDQARAPRYVHVTAVLLLVALLGMFVASSWYRTYASTGLILVLTGLILIGVVSGISVLRGHAWFLADVKADGKTQVLAMAAAMTQDDVPVVSDARPIPHSPDISVEAVQRLLLNHPEAVPDTSNVSQDEIDAALVRMQYSINSVPTVEERASLQLAELSDAELVSASSDCISVKAGATDPQVVVQIEGEGMISVESDVTGAIEVFPGDDSAFSQEVATTSNIGPGSPSWIRVAEGVDALRIDPPSGSTTRICGADA